MPVVNVKDHGGVQACETKGFVYVGRRWGPKHFGNPFSHLANTSAPVRVATREEAISNFEDWVRGRKFLSLEPDRRKWVLDNLITLRGKTLACHCKPDSCHAEVLEKLANEMGGTS